MLNYIAMEPKAWFKWVSDVTITDWRNRALNHNYKRGFNELIHGLTSSLRLNYNYRRGFNALRTITDWRNRALNHNYKRGFNEVINDYHEGLT